MEKATIIGVDLGTNVFQVHGAAANGTVLFRRTLTPAAVPTLHGGAAACLMAMDACGGAHHRAREMRRIGRDLHVILPSDINDL